MVSHDTRDLMLVLITRGKELHLSNKRIIVVYGFSQHSPDDKKKKEKKKRKLYSTHIKTLSLEILTDSSMKSLGSTVLSIRTYLSRDAAKPTLE